MGEAPFYGPRAFVWWSPVQRTWVPGVRWWLAGQVISAIAPDVVGESWTWDEAAAIAVSRAESEIARC